MSPSKGKNIQVSNERTNRSNFFCLFIPDVVIICKIKLILKGKEETFEDKLLSVILLTTAVQTKDDKRPYH